MIGKHLNYILDIGELIKNLFKLRLMPPLSTTEIFAMFSFKFPFHSMIAIGFNIVSRIFVFLNISHRFKSFTLLLAVYF